MSRFLVTQYQAEIQKIIQYGGSRKETAIRGAFQNLLNEYCKTRNYLLIPELDFKTRFNTVVYPDGTVKDAIRLEHGWWEAKDQYDNLDEEIEKKFAKGYPDENTLFEDSQTAVLIQHKEEVARVSMKDADGLDQLLNTFIDYERLEVRDFGRPLSNLKKIFLVFWKRCGILLVSKKTATQNFATGEINFLMSVSSQLTQKLAFSIFRRC